MKKVFRSGIEALMTTAALGVFVSPALALYEVWGVIPAVIHIVFGGVFASVVYVVWKEEGVDDTLSMAGQLSISILLGVAWLPLLLWEASGQLFDPKTIIQIGTDEEEA